MRFIHVAVRIRTSFPNGSIMLHWIDTLHFICPFLSWWTFGFFPLVGYYKWMVLLWTLKFLFEYLFSSSFGYIPRSGIARSYGLELCVKFLRDCPTVFHSSCIILHPPQQCPVFPHSNIGQKLFWVSRESFTCQNEYPIWAHMIFLVLSVLSQVCNSVFP